MTALFAPAQIPREPQIIAPGAIHLPGHLTLAEQERIVVACRELGRGPVPFHHPHISSHPMSVSSLSVGWHWTQSGYRRRAIDINGREVLPVPHWMVRLSQHAVARAIAVLDSAVEEATSPNPGASDSTSVAGSAGKRALGIADKGFVPDAGLINFYSPTARMGMHQDAHERRSAPIVSLSVGDSCTFRFGNTEHRGQPYQDIILFSGDAFVFGGASRFAFHGVPKIHSGTAPAGCGLDTGRLNLTVRSTGLPEHAPDRH